MELSFNKLVTHSLKFNQNLNITYSSKYNILENIKGIKYLGLTIDHRLNGIVIYNIYYINNILCTFFFIFKEARYILNNTYNRN